MSEIAFIVIVNIAAGVAASGLWAGWLLVLAPWLRR